MSTGRAERAERARRRERERDTARFILAVTGVILGLGAVILALGMLLAGAFIPILVMGVLPALLIGAGLVWVAWGVATGKLGRDDRRAIAGGVVVILGAIVITLTANHWLGIAFLFGGAFFVITLYGLNDEVEDTAEDPVKEDARLEAESHQPEGRPGRSRSSEEGSPAER